jgi:disulfide bond formation protein DsbB
MLDKTMSIRLSYTFGLIVIIVLLLFSLYLQHVEGIIPCPLCSLQRFMFVLLGLFCLIGILLHAKFWGRLIINLLCAAASIFGMVLASRQIWLQNFPLANGNECSVSLEYMLGALPLNEVLQKIFHGSVECSQRTWEFLHLDMAEWALVWFALFLLMAVYLTLKEFKLFHHR